MNRPPVTSEILDRLPPHDATAEMNLIGSLMLDPGRCVEVAQLVGPDDFYVDANRRLFAHILGLFGDGGRVDQVLLLDRLRSSGDLEAIGGMGYLAEVVQSVAVAAHAPKYAAIVANHAKRRRVIHEVTETLRRAYDDSEKPEAIATDAAERLLAVTTDSKPATANTAEVFAQALDEATEPRTDRPIGFPVGLVSFDRDIGGLYRSELTILAARPSMGKTALATQLAVHFADRGLDALFISLEMSAGSLAKRILAARAGVNSFAVRNGLVNADDRQRLRDAYEALPVARLRIVDRHKMTVAEVRWEIMRTVRTGGVHLVVVDYLTRLQPADPRAQRYLQVGQLSGDLKRLALEFDVPVLCLAQLGRAAEGKGETRPRLSHLRESGDIEQDADVIGFLHRPERVDRNDGDVRGKAFLFVEKNRNGPVGDFVLRFDAATGVFTDPAADVVDDF